MGYDDVEKGGDESREWIPNFYINYPVMFISDREAKLEISSLLPKYMKNSYSILLNVLSVADY